MGRLAALSATAYDGAGQWLQVAVCGTTPNTSASLANLVRCSARAQYEAISTPHCRVSVSHTIVALKWQYTPDAHVCDCVLYCRPCTNCRRLGTTFADQASRPVRIYSQRVVRTEYPRQ